jgi:hypothetical protein
MLWVCETKPVTPSLLCSSSWFKKKKKQNLNHLPHTIFFK